MNLRELNYIFIPRSLETWERLERSRLGRFLAPLVRVLSSITTEGQVLLVVMLVAGAAGIDVRFSHLYLIFCGLFSLMLTAFLMRPLASVEGLEIEVEAPSRTAAGETVHLTVVLRNRGRRTLHALRVRGPFLPWDGSWTGPRPSVPTLEPGEVVRLLVALQLTERGERRLGRFHAASVRPLALVSGSRVSSDVVVVTILPRIATVQVDAIAASGRARLDAAVLGGRSGESFELHGVRPYRPGDRIRDLHARAWARAGVPIVREYREETPRSVAVILDAAVGRCPREHFEAAVSLTAGLVAQFAAERAQVLLWIAGQPPAFVRLGDGGGDLVAALDALATAQPRPRGPRRWPAAALASETVLVLLDDGPEALAELNALSSQGVFVRPVCVARQGADAGPIPRIAAADVLARRSVGWH